VAGAFFQQVLGLTRAERLFSDKHFSVDGTLIQAWAGQKSFVRRRTTPQPPDDPRNAAVNFHGASRPLKDDAVIANVTRLAQPASVRGGVRRLEWR